MANEIAKTKVNLPDLELVTLADKRSHRAKYGTGLLTNLAKILRARVRRGYNMSEKLTWSHICELVA